VGALWRLISAIPPKPKASQAISVSGVEGELKRAAEG
jgi:hypothetical protein